MIRSGRAAQNINRHRVRRRFGARLAQARRALGRLRRTSAAGSDRRGIRRRPDGEHSAPRAGGWLTLSVLALAAALAGCASGGDRLPGEDSPGARLDRLAWLVGDWRRVDGLRAAGERWWRDGDVYHGEAWREIDGAPVLDERLSIEAAGGGAAGDRVAGNPQPIDGGLNYVVTPAGRDRRPTALRLVGQAMGTAAFEVHDPGLRRPGQPWRVEYASNGDLLLARVYLAGDGEVRARVIERAFVRP